MSTERLRFWTVLTAALLPGSCALVYSPEVYQWIRTEGIREAFSDIFPWFSLLGFLSAGVFGVLVVQKIRGRPSKFYEGVNCVGIARIVIIVAAIVWLMVAFVSQADG
jgi:hypothetical protein